MDATQADIYLVSRSDRSTVIGRPYIYLAVDTASQIIAGVYIGFDAGLKSVISCLANAARDKKEFCAEYGIDIAEEQWPSKGIPYEIITDQGREFIGEGMDSFCMRYGTELHVLPPFRPDQKGIVEKTFDLLQARYKPLLRGKGVIEADAQERWAADYRKQAVLTIDEFTAVVINCIINLNSGRLLASGKTASQTWMHMPNRLLQVDSKEVYHMGLAQMEAKVSRKGIGHNGFWYAPNPECQLRIGDKCRIAVDSDHVDTIFIVVNERFYPCSLTPSCQEFLGMDAVEAQVIKQQISIRRKRNEVSVQPDQHGVRIACLNEMSYRRLLWGHEPITDFWRVGPGYARKLAQYGIFTMGDVARCSIGKDYERRNQKLLYKLFGVNAELLIDHAWGWESCTMKDIKAYRPAAKSLGSGQVLHCPYACEQAKVVTREMVDSLILDLVEKGLVASQLVLTVGYDRESLTNPEIKAKYHGPIKTDHYGRSVPAHSHGSTNFGCKTSSAKLISEAAMKLYDRIVNPDLLVRRLTISANGVVSRETVQAEHKFEQIDLFTDYAALDREMQMQLAMVRMRRKYGKNALLKGTNFLKEATGRDRNGQIGGHKA